MENIEEQIDEIEIEEELLKIQMIHESFNETNPLTYSIMLSTNRHRLTQAQIRYLEMMANKYTKRQQNIYEKWSKYMRREASDEPQQCLTLEVDMTKQEAV